MTDGEMIIKLHDIARTVEQYGSVNINSVMIREIADRLSELSKKVSEPASYK